MMGVHILEGDWEAEMAGAAIGGNATSATRNSSARQRRWTAFRSWYRGGRVFDRADDTLIAAAMLRRPPSPGSLGRPLTPRMTPADGPQPAAPSATQGREEEQGEEVAALPEVVRGTGGVESEDEETAAAAAAAVTAAAATLSGVGSTEVSEVAGGVVSQEAADEVTFTEGVLRGQRTESPDPPAPPEVGAGAGVAAAAAAMVHVPLLETERLTPAQGSGGAGTTSSATADGLETEKRLSAAESIGPLRAGLPDRGADTARLSGIGAWDEEGEEGEQKGGSVALVKGQSASGLGLGDDAGGTLAEGLPPVSREDKTAAAKRLRMEARRKFLAARTVHSKLAAVKASRKSNSNCSERWMSRHVDLRTMRVINNRSLVSCREG